MIQKFILVALCAALALPAHAGQGTIQETDTQIIIEYSGSDDDVKAAQIQHEEVQKQVQEEDAEIKKKEAEEQRHQERMEQAKRRAANRGMGVVTEQ